MPGKIVVLGESNKEIYCESDFYDNAIDEIVSQLSNFIRYNPDDLSKEVIKKVIIRGFSKIPVRVIGPVHLKGEEAVTLHLSF